MSDLLELDASAISADALATPLAWSNAQLKALARFGLPQEMARRHALQPRPRSVVRKASVALIERLERAAKDGGARELLVGEPGCGKSTFIRTLNRMHEVIPGARVEGEVLIDGDKLPITYGAQDISAHDDGAYTGEVSGTMLSKLGCSYVVMGHSERREYHGETNEQVAAKAAKAIEHGIAPIVCVGEGLDVRERGEHVAYTLAQLGGSLDGVDERVVVAYEPVWAIGANGIPASADYADARQAEIIAVAQNVLGRKLPCLYGGSVNPGNCEELISCPHIDGLFIGRSAWNVDGYLDILARCAATIGDTK